LNAYILDASVAAKWLLTPDDEMLVPEALAVRDAFANGRLQLIVPDLFWPEIGNVLWKAVRNARLAKERAHQAIQDLSIFGLLSWPSQRVWPEAFAIASKFQCSVNDATYVALAHLFDVNLLTADERLANGLAAHFPIRWLGAI
jgi:predicted nucleic acid-binding protein